VPLAFDNRPSLANAQSLLLTNNNAFAVDYEWELGSPAFTVSPASGRIEPKKTAEATVQWIPTAPLPVCAAAAATGTQQGASPEATAKSAGKGAAAAGGKSKASAAAAGSKQAGAAAAGAAGEGGWLVQSAAMVLRLKGSADVPQRVALVGELPSGCLRAREKEVALGPVPVGERQVAIVTLRNSGSGEAAFRVRLGHGRWQRGVHWLQP
jgi:hypothetical protein